MIGAAPFLVAVLALGAPLVKNEALAVGIELYEAQNYAEALQSLTAALGVKSNRSEQARVHLYIGLIQHRYKQKQDAEDSFRRALEFDSLVRLPRDSPERSKAMFARIRKAEFPDEAVDPPPRAKKRAPKSGRAGPNEGRDVREPRNGHPESGAEVGDHDGTSTATAARGSDVEGEGDEGDEPALPRYRPEKRGPSVDPPITDAGFEPRSKTPIAAWVSIGVGVVATATGITFGALAAKNAAEANAPGNPAVRSNELYETAVKQRTGAIVSFGVSGAALGLAAVLFLTK